MLILNNHSLRAPAQGRYVSINFAPSIKEATFLSYTLQQIRDGKLDLDQVADTFCQQNNFAPDSTDTESQQKRVK